MVASSSRPDLDVLAIISVNAINNRAVPGRSGRAVPGSIASPASISIHGGDVSCLPRGDPGRCWFPKADLTNPIQKPKQKKSLAANPARRDEKQARGKSSLLGLSLELNG